jgi:hypothetical protein
VNGPYAVEDGNTHIKPVIHFWREKDDAPGEEKPNESFDNVIRGIDFVLGDNPGAVAVRHQSCEGSAIQDVKIDASGAFAGVYDLIGSGGSITDLEVDGGKYGIYASNSQPAPLITGVELNGQSIAAIYYHGKSPLTVVGFTVTKKAGPVFLVKKAADGREASGNLSLVDGSIELQKKDADNVVVQNIDRAIYLRNVYMKFAGYMIRHTEDPGSDIAVAGSDLEKWIRVDEYAYDKGYDIPVKLVDGQYVVGHTYPESGPYYAVSSKPPADLLSRHIWEGGEKFVAFDQPGVINVKDAPYNAAGDGVTDDTAALQSAIDAGEKVFLPKGRYVISDSLRLKSNTQLFGISKTASIIVVNRDSAPDVDTPMIASPNDANATTVLANLKLMLPVNHLYYGIDWQAGRHSIVKDVWVTPVNPQYNAPDNPSLHWVVIHGNGGGRWYNLLAPATWGTKNKDFRIQYIENTSEPLLFYMFHSQYARSLNNDPQAEIIHSSNVTIFAAKFERVTNNSANAFSNALRITGSRNVTIIGNSGVLQPLKGREIFRLNETGDSANDNEDITIANMGKNNGGSKSWNYVKETYRGEDYVIPGGIIGTLFKRGHSTIVAP